MRFDRGGAGLLRLGDRLTPVKIGAAMVALNLSLDLTLIWPLAEAGLAVSTAAAASVQVIVLMVVFSRHKAALDWAALVATAARTIAATIVMALAGYGAMAFMPSVAGFAGQIARVVVPLGVSLAAYVGAYRVLGGREPGMLWQRGGGPGKLTAAAGFPSGHNWSRLV